MVPGRPPVVGCCGAAATAVGVSAKVCKDVAKSWVASDAIGEPPRRRRRGVEGAEAPPATTEAGRPDSPPSSAMAWLCGGSRLLVPAAVLVPLLFGRAVVLRALAQRRR